HQAEVAVLFQPAGDQRTGGRGSAAGGCRAARACLCRHGGSGKTTEPHSRRDRRGGENPQALPTHVSSSLSSGIQGLASVRGAVSDEAPDSFRCSSPATDLPPLAALGCCRGGCCCSTVVGGGAAPLPSSCSM